MSTFYVRKNGSGTHTTIQSAIYVAVSGDTVDIGEGTFNENVEISSKSITLQGAGKDKTIIQGKATNDTFTGCSYYGGEFVTTVSSTSGLIVGKTVSGLTANAKISEIVSSTQFKTAVANPTAGNIAKNGVTWSSGSSTIILPSATAVVVGMKVEGTGVAAFVSAYNATTKFVTLSSPTTQAGSAASLLFRKAYSNITVTQLTNPATNAFPGSIMVSGNTEGLVIKNLRAIGFENSDLGQEAAALFMYTNAAPGHNNFLIDNCQITAGGDCAFLHGSKPFLTNGTFQNCVIDGNTFTGSEPTDVPSFSTYISAAIISSIGASSSVVTFADMRGVIIGRTFSSAGAFTSSAVVTAISGNSVTINKVITGTVGASIDCTFGLTQYGVPNVPRNLFYLGTTSPLYNVSNITFKNNLVSGRTGAVISATGSKSVFNCGVTINSIGGLIENNVFDGNFGAGSPNEMGVNYVLRSLQSNMIVQNNVNITSGGRGNSGYLIELGTSINNTTVDSLLIEVSQSASNAFVESIMEKGTLKAISKVASDAVFSNEANWRMVSFVFKHTSSSRRLVSSFKSTFDYSKKTKLKTNMNIGDTFELHKIIICKPDGSYLVVKRSEISGASSFDFILMAGVAV